MASTCVRRPALDVCFRLLIQQIWLLSSSCPHTVLSARTFAFYLRLAMFLATSCTATISDSHSVFSWDDSQLLSVSLSVLVDPARYLQKQVPPNTSVPSGLIHLSPQNTQIVQLLPTQC